MKPKKIFIMRHAESMEDIDNTIYAQQADIDISLSPIGYEQSKIVAKQLVKKMIGDSINFYLAPVRRVIETYNCIVTQFPSNINISMKIEPRIIKQNWGSVTIDNRREIEIERYKTGVLIYRFPNGESGTELIERSKSFVNELFETFEEKSFPDNVVIITHGFEMRILLMIILNWSSIFFEKIANPKNCELVTLALKDEHNYVLKEKLRFYKAVGNPNHINRI